VAAADGLDDAQPDPDLVRQGQVLAVWGPAGAPGRTTLAVTLAAELAALGLSTLLVDADPYGGTVAQHVGLLDEVSGLAAAVRAANSGTLDVPRLAGLARDLGGGLRVLTGLPRADRWPELRAAGLEAVVAAARSLVDVTVIDCGFCLEGEEEWSYDAAAGRRNAATLTAIGSADQVLVVAAADPVGLVRLGRGLSELASVLPDADPLVVLNRLRGPSRRAQDADDVVLRHCGRSPIAGVPLDVPAVDLALAAGRTLTEAAPRSPARLAIAALAARLTGRTPAQARRGPARRRKRAPRHAAGALTSSCGVSGS
jgi:MinD-like ATPase involved in chromosome partitioning or flagellar assembly